MGALELLTQMVRKEASEGVHSRKFPVWCKTSEKIVRLLSKIKWNKFAVVELLTQTTNKSSIQSCALEKVPHKSMLDFCPKIKWNKFAAVELLT